MREPTGTVAPSFDCAGGRSDLLHLFSRMGGAHPPLVPIAASSRRREPIPLLHRVEKGQVQSHVAGRAGLVVRCEGGSIWLSDGRGGDHVLEAGDRWETSRRGLVVVEALEASRYELRVVAAPGWGALLLQPSQRLLRAALRRLRRGPDRPLE